MTGFTSLKALALITKLYTGYAYSLAFIFQSSLVLLLAASFTVIYMLISDKSRRTQKDSLSAIKRQRPFLSASSHTVRHTYRRSTCRSSTFSTTK